MAIHIKRDEIKDKLDHRQPLVIVEALPAKHFEQAHLPGALNIPHDAVDASAARLLPDRDAEIVVYCANAACKNSAIAAQRLEELGYRNVREYHDGKADWIEAGFPVESSAGRAAG